MLSEGDIFEAFGSTVSVESSLDDMLLNLNYKTKSSTVINLASWFLGNFEGSMITVGRILIVHRNKFDTVAFTL